MKELLASGGDISDVGGWCRFPRHSWMGPSWNQPNKADMGLIHELEA